MRPESADFYMNLWKLSNTFDFLKICLSTLMCQAKSLGYQHIDYKLKESNNYWSKYNKYKTLRCCLFFSPLFI